MNELCFHIDRLKLRLSGSSRLSGTSGLSEADARRLARLVAQGLTTATSLPTAVSTEVMRLSIEMRPNETLESAAQRIAAEIRHELVRTP